MLEIRKALVYDIDSVYRLICELEAAKFDYEKFRKVFLYNLGMENVRYLLAILDGEVIGFGSVIIKTPLHHACRVAEIVELVVSGQNTSKGIGTELLKQLEEVANASNCESIEVVSNMRRSSAHKFYEQSGYHKGWYGFSKKFADC
jgi:(aminoalkyl)phosphonate N-acetyltransferase